MNPKISVCIPTFNRAQGLRQTIDAMLGQTVSDFEIIIGDDASSDETPEMVASIGDPRIRYHRHPQNVGIYPNWNRLIELARGEYIVIYHDHDIYLPTILERSAELLDKHPRAVFAHTALVMIDEENRPVQADVRPFPEVMEGTAFRKDLALSWHSPVMAATAMVRREAYRKVGPYEDEAYGLGCDKQMWFRLAGLGDVAYVAEPQVFIRARTRGKGTARFNWRAVEGSIRMREEEIPEVFGGAGGEGAGEVRRQMEEFRSDADRLLLPLMVRCLLMDEDQVPAGEELLRNYGSRRTRALVRQIKANAWLRAPLRGLGLPLHERRVVSTMAANRKEAEAYLARHPELLRLYEEKVRNAPPAG